MAFSGCGPRQTAVEEPDDRRGGEPAWSHSVGEPVGSSGDAQAGESGLPEAPQLTWKEQMAIDVASLKRDDALRYIRVRTAIPEEDDPDDPEFIAVLSGDPRTAGVLLHRLLSASEPPASRVILAGQLPYTRGAWQEGAAVLVHLDPEPEVRKALVETMRYAEAPHAVVGLRNGLLDEEASVRAAAARTAAFQPAAVLVEAELLGCLAEDRDWETRAAAAHTLGILGQASATAGLVAGLKDRDRRVRLEALLALERIDGPAAAAMDEVLALRYRGDGELATEAKRIVRRYGAAKPR